jgi:hypothetical protein
VEDPFLTTQALKVPSYFHPDKLKAEKYFSILKDLNFRDYIKVWNHKGKFILIDNYEYFQSLNDFYTTNPEQKITCLVIDNADIRYVKELALRLQNISPSDNHVDRCLNIRMLCDVGLSQYEIRQIYGIKKAQSAEGRKFQRDYRIAKNSILFNRVVGIDGTSDNVPSVVAMARPKISKATLNYKLADLVIGILGENESYLKAFDREYEKYLDGLREGYLHEDEQVKAIYTWTSFSRSKVEAIARKIGRDGEQATFNEDYLLGDKDVEDQKWSVEYKEAGLRVILG